MENPTAKPKTLDPHFTLSPRQEQLLTAALISNKPPTFDGLPTTSPDNFSMPSASILESPGAEPGSGTLGFEESPFGDYEYEFDPDGNFDYDFNNATTGQMIGQLPGTSSDGDAETSDKRAHPEDSPEDEEGRGKRREGEEKGAKKPGRKPLTSEPISKRKAQNRAAQRAFRERKEKHLKDLETKVEDLEKASESANHENSILRAQIEKMSMELREYRKRLSLTGNSTRNSLNGGLPSYLTGARLGGLAAPNDVNFQFEFPRFGRLPGPPSDDSTFNGSKNSVSPPSQTIPSPVDSTRMSPGNQAGQQFPISNGSNNSISGDMSSLSGLFSPTLLQDVSTSNFDFFAPSSRSNSEPLGQMSTGQNTSYSSPSASSNSNNGPSSSCGTSPEPTTQSPAIGKISDPTLTTIGEENNQNGEGELTFCEKLNMACGNPNNPVPQTMSETGATSGNTTTAFEINGIDWFAQQNGNQFDPQLFGDYREPQENILSGDAFTDSFFNDAYRSDLPDFSSPFNMAPTPAPAKNDLIGQIDKQQNADEEVVPGEDTTSMLNCNTIWDRLQTCPKVKEGEFDLDLLCKDLQKKAKCSETGAVVNESDFNKIMKNYVDKSNMNKKA